MEKELMRICTRCDRFAPSAVRKALSGLPCAPSWILGDAMLVASELVTNAVRHSAGGEDQLLTIRVHQAPDRLEISVYDPGQSGGAAEIVERPAGTGGLGLKVVDELSADWGTERRADGYRVWAQLALAARPGDQQPRPARRA